MKSRRLRQCPHCAARVWSTSCVATGRWAKAQSGQVGTEVACPRCGKAACYLDFDRRRP